MFPFARVADTPFRAQIKGQGHTGPPHFLIGDAHWQKDSSKPVDWGLIVWRRVFPNAAVQQNTCVGFQCVQRCVVIAVLMLKT